MPDPSTTRQNRMLDALSRAPRQSVLDAALADLERMRARFDGWQNPVTGLGTARDKTTYNTFLGPRYLSDLELANLYHGSDLAARMVDVVPDEMLREGFEIDLGDAGLTAEVTDQLESLDIYEKLADAIRWGRCFGGGALLLGADDGRSAATPLIAERAKSLSFLYVLDRRYLWPLTYYSSPGHPKLGQPETYMVTSPSARSEGSPMSVVHESRLVLFGGASTGIRERELNSSWDFSILQRAHEVLGMFEAGWQAVSVLLQDGNQAIFKMSGLAEAIGNPGGQELLRKRLEAIDLARSIVRAIVVDAGDATEQPESFERQVFPLTGIPETLDKLMLRLSAAVQIPVTILMGQSPAGMNATGESDFRWFYDRVRSEQTRRLAPRIRRIVRVMLSTRLVAREAKAIKIKFPPLWSEPPSTAAATRKTLLDGDAVAINAGMLLPEEAALARFRQDGFNTEITLSDEASEAREEALKGELDRLESGEEPGGDDPFNPSTLGPAPFPGEGESPPGF